MTHLEDRITRALTHVEPPRPPRPVRPRRRQHRGRPASRRRHGLTVLAGAASSSSAVTTVAVLTLTPRPNGALAMPWWILELATTLVLVAIALWLGPFIKRFGRAYAADVFHDNPLTGKSFLVLTDIVYYLIFAAYILLTANFAPQADWNTTSPGSSPPSSSQDSVVRDRRHPARHRHPARAQHRAHAGARPAVLAQPEAVGVPEGAAPVTAPTGEHGRREVGVVEHPRGARGGVDLGEVETLAADVAGVHLGCRVGLLRAHRHRTGRCPAAPTPRTARRPRRSRPRGRPARAGAGRSRRPAARRPGPGAASGATVDHLLALDVVHGPHPGSARRGTGRTSRSRIAAWS